MDGGTIASFRTKPSEASMDELESLWQQAKHMNGSGEANEGLRKS